ERPAETVLRLVGVRAVEDAAAEEGDVARVKDHWYLFARVPGRDLREVVFRFVGMAHAVDALYPVETAMPERLGLGVERRVDRFVFRADGHPQAAVVEVRPVEREPGAAQGVRNRGDVVAVLVIPLSRLARPL